MVNLLFLIHTIGIIIGLGAVTVIDWMGFLARKNKEWTQVTIKAHHLTRVLILSGFAIVTISWIFIYLGNYSLINNIKTLILGVLFLDGLFLNLYVSPRLDKLYNKNKLLPLSLQKKIVISMLISFIGWWSFVILTFIY